MPSPSPAYIKAVFLWAAIRWQVVAHSWGCFGATEKRHCASSQRQTQSGPTSVVLAHNRAARMAEAQAERAPWAANCFDPMPSLIEIAVASPNDRPRQKSSQGFPLFLCIGPRTAAP